MEANSLIQIIGIFFQTIATLLGITSAFYIYLNQAYRSKFLSYDGEEKRLRFENPSWSFWIFLLISLATLCMFLFLISGISIGTLGAEKFDLIILCTCLISGIDLIFFGTTIKDLATYPDKMRRFLRNYDVFEDPLGFYMLRKKKSNKKNPRP